MASPRSAWGIDIGNRALKAVKLNRDGDTIRVEDFDFIEHETILSQAGDNREDLIRQAIATFAGRKNTKGSAVAVGVSGQTSFAHFIKLPPVDAKQIPQIVKFEAIQQIPFPLDEVEWAYQLFQSPDSPDIECGIFAMRKELVNQWVGQFTAAGLNVQAVQTNPLAVYNAIQRDGRLATSTAMIIDVGAENTDLIIASENSIWMRSIPIGGNSFTETIMKAFKLPMHKAEELKHNAASSKYYRQILQAMRPVFADLVAEIQRSIGFYGSVNRENKINKIIALGGTFRMPSLPKYLQQNLSLDVERPDNFAAGLPDDSKLAAALTENVLSLHSAYGLALQAMGETKVDSSLLPTAIRRRKMWQEKNKWFATAAALVLGGVAVAGASYVINSTAFGQQQDKRDRAATIQGDATTLDSGWKEVQSSGGPQLQQIKNINSLISFRELWPSILTEVTNALPKPPKELADALAAADAEAVKKIPRAQRPLIQIDAMLSRYYPDLSSRLRAPDLGQFRDEFDINSLGDVRGGNSPFGGGGAFDMAATADPAAAGTPGERGYLVMLRLVSPHENAESELVVNDLIKRLAAVKTDGKGTIKYAFMKPSFVAARRVREDTDMTSRLRADHQAMISAKTAIATPEAASGYNGGGYNGNSGSAPLVPDFGDGGGMSPQRGFGGPVEVAPTDVEADAFKDRLTDEDMLNDKVIDVIFAIVLDPAPPPPVEQPAADAPAAEEAAQ